MASASVGKAGGAVIGERLLACAAGHGSAVHAYPVSDELLKGPNAARNLSDAVHFLCVLHGRYPGVIDHAANRAAETALRPWFAAALDAFAAERTFLTRLAVAAGPVPSTPGSAESEAAVLSQRHAVEMLACSERNGCALGAAFALAADWARIRLVLETAGRRFGVDPPRSSLADGTAIKAVALAAATSPAIERALLFGAEQIALQHHGLWDLLEARQQARGGD